MCRIGAPATRRLASAQAAELSDMQGQVLGAAMLLDSAMANNASSR
jgi:hypothetical protein